MLVAAAIAVVTLLAYERMTASLERGALARLESYVRERGRHEQELFELTEATQDRVRREFLARLPEHDGAQFDARFRRDADGVTRNRPATRDGSIHAQVWIGRNVELDTELRRLVVTAHDIVGRYGPGLEGRFINLYFSFPPNALAYYWPGAPDWSTTVDPDLDVRGEEYVRVATPAEDPAREPVWTGVYRDRYGPWMVSCETPIDIDGRHVATVGMDITLDALLERSRTETLPGSHNLVVRDDGRLVVHPELYTDYDDQARDLQIVELDDPGLRETLRLVQELPADEHLAYNAIDEVYLGITRLAGPDWYFVVVYPKQLVSDEAAGAAWIVLLLGVVSLLLEILMVYLVLRREVARPLAELTSATDAMARGEHDAPLPTTRDDELGQLAAAFARMRDAVASKTKELASEAQARLEGELQLQAILDQTPAVVFIKDLDGRYLLTNRRFRALFRHEPEHGVSTDRDFMPPAAARAVRDNDLLVLDGGEPMQFEERVPHADGSEHVYVTVKFPLPDAEGKPSAVCGIATDITARIELEEQLRQSQKMDALGQLAGGVAHDFNNLLTVILGQADLLALALAGQPFVTDIEVMIEAAERARGLTRQLLAFSRKQLYDAEVFDLRDVLGAMQMLLRRLIAEDIAIDLSAGDEVLPVRADRGQIEQLIINLATNARDAMPDGGRLLLEAERVRLDRDEVIDAGEYVRLTVTDTGEGMDEATRKRAMEPFFTTKHGERGTGLGLAIVYGIVSQTGGTSNIRSVPGVGTSVDVFLPAHVAEVEAAPKRRIAPLDDRAGGDETILVLEDSALVSHVTVKILEERGYAVLCADRGESAVELAAAYPKPIDLLLSDVLLPGISGPEAAARIRQQRPEIAVLFMTGHIDERVHVRDLTEGADVLQKPFRVAELAARVRQILDAHHRSSADRRHT